MDIGCGTGIPLTRHLVNILTSKIERKFDGILAWDSLFHIPLDRQENIIKKIIGLLNTNGVFLFTTGGKYGELLTDMFDEKFYYSSLSNDQYKNILEKEKCQVIIKEIDNPSSHGHRVICCRKN